MVCWCGCMLLLVSCKKSDSAEAPAPKQTVAQRGGDVIETTAPKMATAAIGGGDSELTDDALLLRLKNAEFIASPSNYQEACRLTIELAKRNPKLAMRVIPAMSSGLQILLVQSSVSTYLSGIDEQTLTNWFEHPNGETKGMIVGLAMDVLAKVAAKSPDEALRILAKATSTSSGMLLANTMLGIAAADADSALVLAKKYLRSDQIPIAVASIVDRCASNAPGKAMDLIQLHLSGSDATRSYANVLRKVAEHDPSSVAGLLDEIPRQSMAGVLSAAGVVDLLVKCDSRKAADAIGAVVFTEASKGLYTRMAVAMAETDAAQAVAFARGLPAGAAAAKEIIGEVFATMAKSDLQAARTAVAKMEPADQGMAPRGVARTVAVTDFDTALQLARESPADQHQDLYREIARASAYQAPANAVMMLEDPALSQKLGADFRQEMLDTTVRTWASQDLPAAQQWVEKLPASDAPKGVQGLMTTWMKTDPVAASGWLSNQPTGPAREAGARVIINAIKDTDPEMAEQWRKTLAPEEPKRKAIITE